MSTAFEGYFDALTRADAAAATAVLDDALDRGDPPKQLIRDVLVPAQRKVGQLWFEGVWNIADEHAATAVSERALSWLVPPKPSRSTAGRLVMGCAEGEWHMLAARMAAELARGQELDVLLIGGSLPAEDLQSYLRAAAPRALALSCTMPTNLLGASRSIQAAHAAGVPVIVGGAAWGHDDHRAKRLGAQGHVHDAADIMSALDRIELASPSDVPGLPAEALLLDAVPNEVLVLALERQCAASSWMWDMTPDDHDRTLEDLRWLARHTAAAVACEDTTIVRHLLAWLVALRAPQGVPAEAVLDRCYFLADAVEPEAPMGAQLLRRQADRGHQQLLGKTDQD